jgi:hypothetical protein
MKRLRHFCTGVLFFIPVLVSFFALAKHTPTSLSGASFYRLLAGRDTGITLIFSLQLFS